MKFRIKHVANVGYFAQVKPGFFYMWKRIGKHCTGFGLYDASDNSYAIVTRVSAIARCEAYSKWVKEHINYEEVKIQEKLQ